MVSKKDKVYSDYKKATNMSYSELLKWSKNPLSKTASLRPSQESKEAKMERRKLLTYADPNLREILGDFNTANIRNLILLKVPRARWDTFLISQGKKAISYLARAKKIKGTKNRRALKNWAFDRNK